MLLPRYGRFWPRDCSFPPYEVLRTEPALARLMLAPAWRERYAHTRRCATRVKADRLASERIFAAVVEAALRSDDEGL